MSKSMVFFVKEAYRMHGHNVLNLISLTKLRIIIIEKVNRGTKKKHYKYFNFYYLFDLQLPSPKIYLHLQYCDIEYIIYMMYYYIE